MTGFFGKPFADNCIISFGRNKTLNINGGGALLSNLDVYPGYFPEGLRDPLEYGFDNFYEIVANQIETAALWDRYLADLLRRPPIEQIIPWRVMRLVNPSCRNALVMELRTAGFDVGTNYPQLDGVDFDSGHKWGDSVINFWTTQDYDAEKIQRACEVIDMTLNRR